MQIKQLMIGALIGASAGAFMVHSLQRKPELMPAPAAVRTEHLKPQHTSKPHKVASAHKISKHHKSSGDPQLSSRKLFG